MDFKPNCSQRRRTSCNIGDFLSCKLPEGLLIVCSHYGDSDDITRSANCLSSVSP